VLRDSLLVNRVQIATRCCPVACILPGPVQDLHGSAGLGPQGDIQFVAVRCEPFRRDTRSLANDSVANVSRIVTLDHGLLTERVGRVSRRQLELVFTGLDLVLGR
jgi:hypothetical protein